MRYHTFGCLAALIFAVSSQSAWAGEAQIPSRMALYEAQARRYVADRTRTVEPRTRLVEPRGTYVDYRPVRQRIVEDSDNRADVIRSASLHTPTRTVIVTDIVDEDLDRVGGLYDDDSRVEVSRVYTAPSAYAGYNSYNSYSGQRSYSTVSTVSTVHFDSSYASYRARPVYTRAYYSHDYYSPSYRPAYHRPHYGPRFGGYYRSGWGHHRGHWGHHHGGWRRPCGTSWGVSVHFRF